MASVTPLALAHADERDLTQLAEYEAIGGYEALRKARGMEPAKIVEELLTRTCAAAAARASPWAARRASSPRGQASRPTCA